MQTKENRDSIAEKIKNLRIQMKRIQIQKDAEDVIRVRDKILRDRGRRDNPTDPRSETDVIIT